MDLALAVDVGGTKLAAAVIDASGSVRARDATPTIATDDPEVLFRTLTELVGRVRVDAGSPPLRVCGVGCGGPMAGRGLTVSPLNIPAWRAFPLRDRLAEHTGLLTTVDNDAKALALAEGWLGRAAGHSDYLAMVVSTGVGGGIVLDGRLLDGADGNAGHIGHIIVEPAGRLCACGARGCLEAETSGRSIEASTGRLAAEAPMAIRQRTGRLVGRAVASVVNLLDLPLACVAGSVALGFADAFFHAAQSELEASSRLAYAHGAKVVPGGLGEAGPLIGAAAVGWRSIGVDIGVA